MIHRRLTAPGLLLSAILLLAGCARFSPQPLPAWPDPSRVQRLEQEGVSVSAGILTDDESRRLYGVDLADAGLQATWLSIDNHTDRGYWLLVSALDPNYFPPAEAAMLFGLGRASASHQRMLAHFRDLAIPLHAPAGMRTQGFVLAPRHEGGRYLNVSLRGLEGVHEFGFAVPLANGEFDFEHLHAERIYAGTALPTLDQQELRARLEDLPCCTSDAAGQRAGDPVNLVFTGEATDVLASLARAGWSFTHRLEPRSVRRLIGAALSGNPYPVAPVSPLYLFGRPQDLALQRARNTILQRNHLRLWLAPFRLGDHPVWIGQVSRDIAVKASLGSLGFVTHVIDANVDESREALLQSLLVAGVVRRFGFVHGVGAAPRNAMRANLAGDTYFTDGLRVFAEVSGAITTSPEQVEFIDWYDSSDPLRQAPEPGTTESPQGDR